MYECNISEKLNQLRIAKGVTQEDVANALSISNKTVSKWENGASEPDLNMLIALSEYYGVSTDTLLGLENHERSTAQVIANEFKELDRRETALKVFEIIKALFPSSYRAAASGTDDVCDDMDVIPPKTDSMNRYQISLHEIFNFAVCSDDVNLAVIQMRNKSNFSWLYDEEKQNRIVKLLSFLSDPDALKICAFIHTTTCSESFTADYMAKHTGVAYEKTVALLDLFCQVGSCHKVTAHLKSGEVGVYESFGDGIILSIISLAYEHMCGSNGYNYNFNGRCKMIGGKT